MENYYYSGIGLTISKTVNDHISKGLFDIYKLDSAKQLFQKYHSLNVFFCCTEYIKNTMND